MEERSFEERARLSAPCMRTFVNIARRWQLTEREQANLLAADIPTLRGWAATAMGQKHLVLETSTLMRLSALLGVFAELRQFLAVVSGAQEEREWLTAPQQFEPFNGRTPLQLMSGNFEDQMDVRRYLAAIAANADPYIASGFEHRPDLDHDFLDARFAMAPIEAIAFDGYGTLVDITDKRRPFRALVANEPSNALLQRAIRYPIGLGELSQQLSSPVSEERLAELEADLSAELKSVRLRPGMDLLWQAVQRAGLPIAVCSNLAEPYEAPLLEQLPGQPDVSVLSFQTRLMKPQPEIYHLVCNRLGLEPRQVLFAGDSMSADVVGPSAIGSFSMPIAEFERSFACGASFYAPHPIAALFDRIIAAKTA
ncbi:HAD-IA family hydrolase [Bosea sp. NPDC055353]